MVEIDLTAGANGAGERAARSRVLLPRCYHSSPNASNLGLHARTVPALFFCGSIGRWCPESGRQTKYWFPSTTSQRSLSASTVPFQSALGMVLLSPTRL